MTAILLAPRPAHGLVVTPQRAARLARIHGLVRGRYTTPEIARIVCESEAVVCFERAWLLRHGDHMADVIRHGGTA